jgi:hypothetical protein
MEVNIDDFIDQVQNQDFSKASVTFADLMNAKTADALEQEKISLADQIFNGASDAEDEEDDEMDDISDEELMAAADEIESEEEEDDPELEEED